MAGPRREHDVGSLFLPTYLSKRLRWVASDGGGHAQLIAVRFVVGNVLDHRSEQPRPSLDRRNDAEIIREVMKVKADFRKRVADRGRFPLLS